MMIEGHVDQHGDRLDALEQRLQEHEESIISLTTEVYRLKVELIDQHTSYVLAQREQLHIRVIDEAIALADPQKFEAHPTVSGWADRSGISPRQIYQNAVNTLRNEQVAVFEIGAEGAIKQLCLPTSTGLTSAQEALVFQPTGFDKPIAPSKLKAARQAYIDHMFECGLDAVRMLVMTGNGTFSDNLLKLILDELNDKMSTLIGPDEDAEALPDLPSMKAARIRYIRSQKKPSDS